MHYYIDSNGRNGKCHVHLDGARKEVIDAIIEKMGTARSIEHQREAAFGIIKAAALTDDTELVKVGMETWRLFECESFTCSDVAGGRDW